MAAHCMYTAQGALQCGSQSRGSQSRGSQESISRETFYTTPGRVATIYADCNYSGQSQTLSPGDYDMARIQLPNDSISSIRVPAGMRVRLFENSGFGGRSLDVTSDTSCLTGMRWGNSQQTWNDYVSSIRVEDLPNLAATIYADCNYSGQSQTLSPGDYDMARIQLPNDSISSIRVPAGLRVQLFEHAGFGGRSLEVTSDTSCLTNQRWGNRRQTWNDYVSSIKVVVAN